MTWYRSSKGTTRRGGIFSLGALLTFRWNWDFENGHHFDNTNTKTNTNDYGDDANDADVDDDDYDDDNDDDDHDDYRKANGEEVDECEEEKLEVFGETKWDKIEY